MDLITHQGWSIVSSKRVSKSGNCHKGERMTLAALGALFVARCQIKVTLA